MNNVSDTVIHGADFASQHPLLGSLAPFLAAFAILGVLALLFVLIAPVSGSDR